MKLNINNLYAKKRESLIDSLLCWFCQVPDEVQHIIFNLLLFLLQRKLSFSICYCRYDVFDIIVYKKGLLNFKI